MRTAIGICAAVIWILVIDGEARQTPGSPRDLRGVVTANVVTLQWSAPLIGDPPAAYVIEAGSAPGLRDLARLTIAAGVTTLTAAAPNGRYFVRVRGMNGDGEGPPSNEVEIVAVLSSMHISPTMWDAQAAFVGSQRLDIPPEGWIVTPPVVARRFGLIGGSSAWQHGLVAPSIEVVLDENREITGWVTASQDPNDDNFGFWAASAGLLRSWQYTVTVTR